MPTRRGFVVEAEIAALEAAAAALPAAAVDAADAADKVRPENKAQPTSPTPNRGSCAYTSPPPTPAKAEHGCHQTRTRRLRPPQGHRRTRIRPRS